MTDILAALEISIGTSFKDIQQNTYIAKQAHMVTFRRHYGHSNRCIDVFKIFSTETTPSWNVLQNNASHSTFSFTE